MRLNLIIIKTILVFFFITPALGQHTQEFQLLHFSSSHTSFPDTGRMNGHWYDSTFYTASAHYNDSSVLLIIPKQLDTTQKINFIFWFHGWNNNIDTAAEFYQLTRQFIASKRNAVLVLSETARNAPDSYGGKLEQPGIFKALVKDVLRELKKEGFVPNTAEPGNIVLAGHSGAFRVIAYILQNGQMNIQEVFLFDALYSQVDKFLHWINEDNSHHFVHWFTNHGGGTDEMSDTMMRQLTIGHAAYKLAEEGTISPKIIRGDRILFVHSLREHNVIINDPDDFQILLENSFILLPFPLPPLPKGSVGVIFVTEFHHETT
jgi:hypothetical protein